jgi:predicted transcriptional regulator
VSRVKDRPPLSRAETEVARIVWNQKTATVRDVLNALPPDRTVDYKTVQTYLRRLEAKGYLESKLDGRSLVYKAKVKPSQVIRETVTDFVDRLFNGNALPLVEHLIEEKSLSHEEIDRLKHMLDELEQGHARSAD